MEQELQYQTKGDQCSTGLPLSVQHIIPVLVCCGSLEAGVTPCKHVDFRECKKIFDSQPQAYQH